MRQLKLAVIPGDGIGVEVTAAAMEVLQSVAPLAGLEFATTEFPWSCDYYEQHGEMAPADFIDQLQDFDAIFLGALGDPGRVPDHLSLSPLMEMRQRLDQYACVRPARLYPGVRCPLSDKQPGEIDMVVIRENSEGEYARLGGRMAPGTAHETCVQTGLFTHRGVERIIRYAFEFARSQGRRKVTSVTKSNALIYSMVLWDEVFEEVAADYRDIESERILVDACCQAFVLRPEDFDVVVASNLFGDILTDLSAAIVGGLGVAPSANIRPERDAPSMFEPTHGSAPDIAGKGLANPVAAILSVALMLRHLECNDAATRIENAVEAVLRAGDVVTRDVGGMSGTQAMTRTVIQQMS